MSEATRDVDLAQFEGHTPGPWRGDPTRNFDEGIDIHAHERNSDMVPIAHVPTGYDEPFESTQQTNAVLIAAAPALLAEVIRLRALAAERSSVIEDK